MVSFPSALYNEVVRREYCMPTRLVRIIASCFLVIIHRLMPRSHLHIKLLRKTHIRKFREMEYDVATLWQIRGLRCSYRKAATYTRNISYLPLRPRNFSLSFTARLYVTGRPQHKLQHAYQDNHLLDNSRTPTRTILHWITPSRPISHQDDSPLGRLPLTCNSPIRETTHQDNSLLGQLPTRTTPHQDNSLL